MAITHKVPLPLLSLVLATPCLLGARCKPKPKRVPPLCAFESGDNDEIKTKVLPPLTWLQLVSPSLDIDSMTRRGPLRDSCGLVVSDVSEDERFVCEGYGIPLDPAPDDLVEESDLLMSQVGEDKVLLWAATDEVGGGEASGIVSLALWTEKGIEIHATGPLRGLRDGARLRMAYIAEIPVLILESDRCPGGATTPAACSRIAQFVPIIDRRVRELPMYEADRCIGRAQFELSRRAEIDLDAQWSRRFEMVRSIEIDAGQIVLTDLITAHDYNRVTQSPPTPYRKAVSRRPLQLDLVAAGLRSHRQPVGPGWSVISRRMSASPSRLRVNRPWSLITCATHRPSGVLSYGLRA
jgi:hypothetical protein